MAKRRTFQENLDAGVIVPGEVCKYGHAPYRYAASRQCVECSKNRTLTKLEAEREEKRGKRLVAYLDEKFGGPCGSVRLNLEFTASGRVNRNLDGAVYRPSGYIRRPDLMTLMTGRAR